MPDNTNSYQNPNNFTVNPNYEEGQFFRSSVPQQGTDEWHNAATLMYDGVRQSGGVKKYLQNKIYDFMNSNYSKEDIIDSLKGLNERFAGDTTLGDDDRISLDYINNYADYVENLRNGYTYEATDKDYDDMEKEQEERERRERERRERERRERERRERERELEIERQEREKERRENLDPRIQNEPNFDYSSDLQRMKVESEREPLSKRAERINNRAMRVSQKGQNMQDRMNNNNYIKDFRANTIGRKMDRSNRKLDRVDKIMGYQNGAQINTNVQPVRLPKVEYGWPEGVDLDPGFSITIEDIKNRINKKSGNPQTAEDIANVLKNRVDYYPDEDTIPRDQADVYQQGGSMGDQEEQLQALAMAYMQGDNKAEEYVAQLTEAANGGDQNAVAILQYLNAIMQKMAQNNGAMSARNGGRFAYIHMLRTGGKVGEKIQYIRNGARIEKVRLVKKPIERPAVVRTKVKYEKYF